MNMRMLAQPPFIERVVFWVKKDRNKLFANQLDDYVLKMPYECTHGKGEFLSICIEVQMKVSLTLKSRRSIDMSA